jgi:hypothetical protein
MGDIKHLALVLIFNFSLLIRHLYQADNSLLPCLHKCFNVGSNSMADPLIIEKAIEEIEAKNCGVTDQFLKIHELVYENNRPKVARVDRESEDGTAIVYFPVKDQKFFLAVYVDTEPEVSVRHVNTEPYNSVYFKAISEVYTLEELSEMTKLKSTGGRNKGDRRGGSASWRHSSIFFEPNPEADEFEDKIKKLLDYLEQDKEGISALVDNANGHIQVASSFHNGNTMLGGNHLDRNIIKRLANLNLAIDFDLYADGNFYAD